MAREETMGQRLKRLREEKGLSQPGLAEAAGVPVGTLRNWEQDRSLPLLDTAARVADALGCTLDELARDTLKSQPKRRAPKKQGGKGKPKKDE